MTASARGPATADAALLAERLARHGLAGPPCASALEAVARTTAVQAQENLASRLGVRARAPGAVTDADVRAAIEDERSIARTWLLRGTIHLIPSADLPWLVRLVGPAVIRKYGTRWRQLGLTESVRAATVAAIAELLKAGPMTRAEIRDGLAERGVRVASPDPQIHTHVVVHASCTGLICRGPDRGRDSTFVLVDDWLPDAPPGPSGEDALAELARRYFAAYSPATAADFAAWSGLPSRRAIELIRDSLTPVEVGGRPGYRLGEVAPARSVRMLPAFDNYLLGYRDRDALLHPSRHGLVYRGGLIRPVVLLDGRVIGAWALDRASGRVTLEPFESWSTRARRGVEQEVADLGRFLDRPVSIAG